MPLNWAKSVELSEKRQYRGKIERNISIPRNA